jgi:hypothetical protein
MLDVDPATHGHFSLLQDHHVYLFHGSIPGSSLL